MQDILQDILSLIDGGMQKQQPEQQATTIIVAHPTATIDKVGQDSPLTHAGDDINRWRQIVDLADNTCNAPIGNTPKEKYADIDSVTKHAGGGLNGPKDPADMKSATMNMYPDHVAKRGE